MSQADIVILITAVHTLMNVAIWPKSPQCLSAASMAPKRARTLAAPRPVAKARGAQPVVRRTLAAPATNRRTPSPGPPIGRSRRRLSPPRELERRLRRKAWPPAVPLNQDGEELGGDSSSATTSATEVGPKATKQKVLGKTSRKRRQLVARALAEGRINDVLEYLQHTSVQDRTAEKYRRALEELEKRLAHGVELADGSGVDEGVARVLNEWFLEGLPPSKGEVTLASLLWRFPRYGKFGDRKIPLCWRAMRGWRRRAPARSRRPHAFAVWAGIIVEMIRCGYEAMAVYLLFLVTTYMRPSEPLSIRRCDLVPPVAGVSKDWHVNLFPEERPERSKMYAANDSVCLTTKLAPWLVQLLPAMMKGHGSERLFDFAYPTFSEIFEACRKRLSLPAMVPYESRHSGPAIDAARGNRSRGEIKDRGRWKNEKSVIRYEQRARLAQTYQRLPAHLRSHLDLCEKHLGDIVLGRMPAIGLTSAASR